ncbi:hypothetical protein XELAEV_18019470mg [Xenopus laevis]|uniref:G-protein coupled receptors family 1 profile domain-containing protein n=1 Tax=Xenopus laevis TaxID=8355 RepID=A0A974DFT8_XENLA|nr:hypothetical protein XELAEV_18019470mg [Xenopus laevis]
MNQTTVTSFLLLGLENNQTINTLLFVVILWIYILTLAANFLLIILVVTVPTLRSPMYVLFSQLSMSDILLTTNITPNLLWFLLSGGGKRHVSGCITQFFFYVLFTALECLLLTVMSFDLYVAICKPLHYGSIMNVKLCLSMSFWSWGFAFMVALVLDLLISNLQFCGPFVIDHYFSPLLELSYSDVTVVQLTDVMFTIPFILTPFCFIIFTYISIGLAILRVSSTSGRHKAFSTCSSHLIVVCTYFGSLITLYILSYKVHGLNMNTILSFLYTVSTPFFNPVIYSLSDNEIKAAVMKLLSNLPVMLFLPSV